MAVLEPYTRSVRFVGRCKTCKAGCAVDVEELRTPRVQHDKFGPKTTVFYSYPTMPGLGHPSRDHLRFLTVPGDCGHKIKTQRVKGIKSDEPCGSKCLNATGPDCQCSCSGRNHGMGHVGSAGLSGSLDRKTNGTGTHSIYVIELSPDVWDSKRFRDRNRSHIEGSRAVYVGSTETTVQDRMRVHQGLAPGYASHWVRDFGVRLITSREIHGTTEDAERAERETAERWRGRGYAVVQA